MIIREVTLREKKEYHNASYVFVTNAKKHFFTKNALIELQIKLNKFIATNICFFRGIKCKTIN